MRYDHFDNQIEHDHELLKTFFKAGDNIWLQGALGNTMAKAFNREVASAIYDQVGFITPDRIAQVTGRLTKFNYEYVDILSRIFVENRFDKYLGDTSILKYLTWAGEQGGSAAHSKIGISINFEMRDDFLVKQLGNRADYLISTVDQTTKEWIANQIQNGVDNGLTNAEIAKAMSTNAKDIALWRAELITHAETANAMGYVQLHEMKRMGVRKKRWVTSRDDRVTMGCQEREARGAVEIDFVYDAGSDGIGQASAHEPRFPRCRCYTVPVLEGERW